MAANIPIAPMSPQLQNVHASLLRSQYQPSLSIYESKCSTQVKKFANISSNRSQSQCTSMTTNSIPNSNLRHQLTNADSSTANSSSTSPTNLSRSTSPAASIANFIRPISPPCIQVKEPLSPKFIRTSSRNITSDSTHQRHRSPPVNLPSVANNVNASTASATKTLLMDDSSGYDSSENQNNQLASTNANSAPISSTISTVPESCFEPETYRNLYSLNSNQQKKLSLSDPALNQTTMHSYDNQEQQMTTDNTCLLSSSSQRQLSNHNNEIQIENQHENLTSHEDSPSKESSTTKKNTSRKVSRVVFL